MMRVLISVRDVAEALLAAEGGADFIDLKEPRDGALGGLPVERIASIVETLRARGIETPVSATIGDLAMSAVDEIVARVDAVGACGVDYVKVGIERAEGAEAVLQALARSRHAVVPVFIADRGLDFARVAQACRAGFPGVMVDTADKAVGLFDSAGAQDVDRFVGQVKAAGKLVGMAGSLKVSDLPAVVRYVPDFAGFRGAVCAGDRQGALEVDRVRALVDATRSRA